MRVLQITHDYHYTRVYDQLFSHLSPYVEQTVLSVESVDEKSPSPASSHYAFFSLRCLSPKRLIGYWKNKKELFVSTLDTIDPHKFDLIHAHFVLPDGALARHLHKKSGTPYIVTVRASCYETMKAKYKKPHLWLSGLRTLQAAQAIVFPSTALRDKTLHDCVPFWLRKRLAGKSQIFSNGIHPFWLDSTPTAVKRLQLPRLHVLTVGEIIPLKKHLCVLKALESLRHQNYDVTYTIVGAAKDQEILEQLLKTPFVSYFDAMPKEALIYKYREADLFVMTSSPETFGLVYAEALSQGLPVVYTKGEGFDGQFPEGEVGYSAHWDSTQSIVEAITNVLQHYDKIAKRVVDCSKKFDWGKIAKRYFSLYSVNIGESNQ